jgi:outer membrane receptor protein involved in Fe transport
MNYRLLFMMLFLLPILTQAQTLPCCTIQGQLINTEGQPVPAAVIVLQNAKNGTVIIAETTNDEGYYKLNSNNTRNVSLKIEVIGYKPENKTLQLKDSNTVLNFVLTPNKTLSEVTVTSRKPVYEQKIDRTVFNVENSITATGTDAWGALKKTPGILMMNNQVTIAGKGAVGVMINGRLQQLSGDDLAQLLRSIPSDNLSKIEVITTPPAKYDAEGNMGLVNIVTKKNIKQGLKGSVTASYKRNALNSPSLSTTINYGREKFNMYCNANIGDYAYLYTNRTDTYYPGQMWEQRLRQNVHYKSARIQVGADYVLSEKSTLGFVLSEAYNQNEQSDSLISTSFNGGHVMDSVLKSNGKTLELIKGKHTANLNYEWRIDSTGKKLNIDADYYSHIAEKSRNFDARNYMSDGTASAYSDNRMTGNPSIIIQSVKADLELPFKFARLSAGAKVSDVVNKADNVFEVRSGNTYIVDSTRTNAFDYREQIQAAYINAQKSVKKFDMQVGLRAEHTHTTGYSATINQTNVNDYTQLFPTGYVQYRANENHSVNINYSRRINRPGYNMLNPFRFYYSANAYIEGNPNLMPSYRQGIEVSYNYKNKYSVRVFGAKNSGYWDRIIETDTLTGATRYTRANLGRSKWCGIITSVNLNPTKWWECRVSVNGEYNYFKLDHFNGPSKLSSFFPWFETNNSWLLDSKKTWSAELYAYYYGSRQKDYKVWSEMSTVNIGVRKTMLKNNLILALNLDDIFAKAYWFQTNVVNGAKEYSYDNEQGVRFAVTYKFGNKNIKGKRDRNTISEEIQRAN